MAEPKILPQKVVDRKTIILKPQLDSRKAMLKAENLKTSFFNRYGFLKPRPENVVLISLNKYYEPNIVIGGRYSISYCKRNDYTFRVEEGMQELLFDGKRLKPEPIAPGKTGKVIRLTGEEQAHYKDETYFILDRRLQEVPPENLPLAPFEYELKNQPELDYDLRKPNISVDGEIEFLRSKIVRRPADVAEIFREIFELTERTIIYSPIYELTYKNIKNGKHATALINGITGKLIIERLERDSSEAIHENLPIEKAQFFQDKQAQLQHPRESYNRNLVMNDQSKNVLAKRDASIPPRSHNSKVATRLEAENIGHLAFDFLKRLGFKRIQFPTKVRLNGKFYFVELSHQKGTVTVQIDAKTYEVNGYEIQETETQKGFFKLKTKILLFLLAIADIVILMKLINIF